MSTTDTTAVPNYSSDARIEAVMGQREISKTAVIINAPVEQGFACPVHGRETEETYGDTLFWSEYNSFVWCSLCDKDRPSALCCIDASDSTRVYLDTVQQAVARATEALTARLAAVQKVYAKAHEMGRSSGDPDVAPESYDRGFADAAQGLGNDLERALNTEYPHDFEI